MLLIITYRPEFDPPWIGRPYVTALNLNRLGEREIAAMIERITGNKSLPENIRRDIIERTDGIPLFVEEMTKAVLEAEGERAAESTVAIIPSPSIGVPPSLHASLMARLDRLGPAKEVAQIGAAVGRCEFLEPKIAEHRGRIVKRTGDGVLIEFASAVDATRCAVGIQRGMTGRNAEVPSERRIEFRIGVHVGDIIVEEDDIFGDGVNIAARLESIAKTGGVSISEDAWRQVQGKIDATFVDTGEQSLKNIARRVRVYRVELNHGNVAQSAPSLSLPDGPSIAVLPFQNMSGDFEQDYFCDGMVEDIITGLARIKWLFVIGRNSSSAYKGKSPDIRQVGRDLGVRYVLEGSVRRVGNRVRITSQLVDAQTGLHLWAERFDRSLDDIFALQDEITLSVVGAIEPSLRQAEIKRVERKRPSDLNAYDLVLRAIPLAHSVMPDGASRGLSLLRQTLAREPD